ncbi:secreted RxLR effector peptide protein, putative [Phytophthora infestans T30-4]|uniref:Secreted RxLR effector peptide protein, putative n=1 Tax=Phytophthora infestans (strain T30-4) TaxID=403677 RepID=D0N950_PHYIT|nr:secreted RxLR effector peptide protein, putative [Phytophthora infestans T30-4]EEY54338.1 secreted RxLR effector peptide protein, putative [Phytophthora infestans T30-4]|eukprot:XP_002904160.1 secreted RxLR effector peptide protein, putative [Phytophthora infestans T30-4]
MRSLHVLIAMVAALLVCFSAAEPSNVITNQRRLLRGDNTVEVRSEDSACWSTLKTKIKLQWWLETGRSDDYVMKKLKLNGLKGAALTTHKNYQIYDRFAKKALMNRLSKRLEDNTATYSVWKELGLDHVSKASDLPKIMNSENFKIYEKYVKAFDDRIIHLWRTWHGVVPQAAAITREVTEAEMTARTFFLAQSKIKTNDAKVLLGLTVPGKSRFTLAGDALESHVDYKYFNKIFVEEGPSLKNQPLTLKLLASIAEKISPSSKTD